MAQTSRYWDAVILDMASYKILIAKVTTARTKEMEDTTLKLRVLVNGYVLSHMKHLRNTVR